jgi:hypothetical protein
VTTETGAQAWVDMPGPGADAHLEDYATAGVCIDLLGGGRGQGARRGV